MDTLDLELDEMGELESVVLPEQSENVRSVKAFRAMPRNIALQVMSERNLERALPYHLEDGSAYHVITFGDVDAMSFARHLVRDQPVSYLLVSTWYMAKHDAEELNEFVTKGRVGRLDVYLGDIMKSSYRQTCPVLYRAVEKCGGRVARFKNHSKIIVAMGERYSAVVESSANFDTNPRCEQFVLTLDRELALFYKGLFDKIRDFDGRYKDWEPWKA